MSSAIQNRLVGTIILVALAVIFLPDILDGKKESNKDLFVDLPTRPQMKPVVEAQPFPSDTVQRNTAREVEVLDQQVNDDPQTGEVVQAIPAGAENQAGESISSDATLVEEDTSLQQATVVEQDEDKLLQSAGWVVQLGVFRHQKNVRDLLDKLEAAGYRAFSQPVKTSAGEFTKVFVGPDVQKSELEKAIPHLNELTKLQGRLTPFSIK